MYLEWVYWAYGGVFFLLMAYLIIEMLTLNYIKKNDQRD